MFANLLTLNDCNQILAKYTNNNWTRCDSFVVKKKSESVLGFLGDHHVLTVVAVDKRNGEKTQHDFFVKSPPQLASSQMEYVKKLNAFEKETALYKDLLPEFGKYFDEPFLPDSYLIKTDSLIVLEDLSSKGYAIKEGYLDCDECSNTLKSLAKLHAASIIYEELRSTPFKRYKLNEHFRDALAENLFVLDDEKHPRRKWLNAGMAAIFDCLKLTPEYRDRSEIKANLSRFVARDLRKLIEPSPLFRNVICHTDLWKNNALFRTNKKDQILCTLIDFQLARYSPPVFDVLIMLYLNLPVDILGKNLVKLLDAYYEEFCSNLKLHNIVPDDILPYVDFVESVDLYKLPASLVATLYAIHVHAGDELTKLIVTNDAVFREFTLINRSKYVCNEFRSNERYRQKCTDAFKILVDALDFRSSS